MQQTLLFIHSAPNKKSEVELQLVDYFGSISDSCLWAWVDRQRASRKQSYLLYLQPNNIFLVLSAFVMCVCMHPLCVYVCVCTRLVEIWMFSFIQLEYKSSSRNRLRVLFKFPLISPSWNYVHSFSKFCKENCWNLCDIYHNWKFMLFFPLLPPLFPLLKAYFFSWLHLLES